MARTPPKTAAGKERKVSRVMGEFGQGKLTSSSGDKVTNPKQAVAIALSESGQARKAPAPARGGGSTTNRLAREVSRRIDRGQTRSQR